MGAVFKTAPVSPSFANRAEHLIPASINQIPGDNKKRKLSLSNRTKFCSFRIHNKKHFPGQTRAFLFLSGLLGCYGYLLPSVMSAASLLVGARDNNTVKGSWDLGSSEVSRLRNDIF